MGTIGGLGLVTLKQARARHPATRQARKAPRWNPGDNDDESTSDLAAESTPAFLGNFWADGLSVGRSTAATAVGQSRRVLIPN